MHEIYISTKFLRNILLFVDDSINSQMDEVE